MIFGFQAGSAVSALAWRWRQTCAGLAIFFLSIGLFAQNASPVSDGPPPPPKAVSSAPGFAPAPPALLPTGDHSAQLLPPITPPAAITNPAFASSNSAALAELKSGSNAVPENLSSLIAETNGLPPATMSPEELTVHLSRRLELARYLRTTRQPADAAPILIDLLNETSPDPMQQSALLEMAALAQDQNELTRAQQIYSQFLNKWPDDLRIPEILLRQGLLFRRMGLHTLALTKFYGVMTSALVLKNDQLDYYIRLVLQAQTEITTEEQGLAEELKLEHEGVV